MMRLPHLPIGRFAMTTVLFPLKRDKKSALISVVIRVVQCVADATKEVKMCAQFKVKYLVYLLLVCIPAFGTILMRSTIERYEGSSLPEMGWSIITGGNGIVIRDIEDPNNDYQTQCHGEYSIHIYDPNNSSYANAYKTFTNSSSEYMVEFYLWIYHSHAPIDSFPLCILKNMPGEGFPLDADITLVLDTCGVNGHRFAIHIKDSVAMHDTAAFIGSVDRWYKIQIYRHPSESDTVVDFYLDGVLKGTYKPMNASHVSNRIILGTTAADSLADGGVFYDDVIVVDYGDVKNEIIAIKDIDQVAMLAFLSEANDYFSRIHPYLIYRNYRYFTPADIYYVLSLSNLLNTNFNHLTNYQLLSYHNELVVKLDQMKLGLLYGNLNENEKKILRKTLDFAVDKGNKAGYDLVDRKER